MQQTKLTATLEIPENIPIKEADILVLGHIQSLADVLGPDSYISTVLTEAVEKGRSNLRLNLKTGIHAMYELETRMLRQENDRLQRDNRGLQIRATSLSNTNWHLMDQNTGLENAREKLEKDIQDLKTQRDNAISMVSTKTCQLYALKQEHEALLMNYDGLLAIISDVDVDVDAMRAENEKLRAENEKLGKIREILNAD